MSARKRIKNRRRALPHTITPAEIRKGRRELARPYFNVEVSYTGGPNAILDAKLKKLARVRSDGSGYHMVYGVRDIEYRFGTRRQAALGALNRILQARLKGVRVFLRSFQEGKLPR